VRPSQQKNLERCIPKRETECFKQLVKRHNSFEALWPKTLTNSRLFWVHPNQNQPK
jgi:hypothetical protein